MERSAPALVGASLLLSGCFGYAPSPLPTPERTTSVRVTLSRPVVVALPEITVQSVTAAEGEVVTGSDSTLVISATLVRSAAGEEFAGGNATVSLPRSAVQTLEVKRLDTLRTGLLVGASVALAVALRSWASGALGGGTRSGGGTTPK